MSREPLTGLEKEIASENKLFAAKNGFKSWVIRNTFAGFAGIQAIVNKSSGKSKRKWGKYRNF